MCHLPKLSVVVLLLRLLGIDDNVNEDILPQLWHFSTLSLLHMLTPEAWWHYAECCHPRPIEREN